MPHSWKPIRFGLQPVGATKMLSGFVYDSWQCELCFCLSASIKLPKPDDRVYEDRHFPNDILVAPYSCEELIIFKTMNS